MVCPWCATGAIRSGTAAARGGVIVVDGVFFSCEPFGAAFPSLEVPSL